MAKHGLYSDFQDTNLAKGTLVTYPSINEDITRPLALAQAGLCYLDPQPERSGFQQHYAELRPSRRGWLMVELYILDQRYTESAMILKSLPGITAFEKRSQLTRKASHSG